MRHHRLLEVGLLHVAKNCIISPKTGASSACSEVGETASSEEYRVIPLRL